MFVGSFWARAGVLRGGARRRGGRAELTQVPRVRAGFGGSGGVCWEGGGAPRGQRVGGARVGAVSGCAWRASPSVCTCQPGGSCCVGPTCMGAGGGATRCGCGCCAAGAGAAKCGAGPGCHEGAAACCGWWRPFIGDMWITVVVAAAGAMSFPARLPRHAAQHAAAPQKQHAAGAATKSSSATSTMAATAPAASVPAAAAAEPMRGVAVGVVEGEAPTESDEVGEGVPEGVPDGAERVPVPGLVPPEVAPKLVAPALAPVRVLVALEPALVPEMVVEAPAPPPEEADATAPGELLGEVLVVTVPVCVCAAPGKQAVAVTSMYTYVLAGEPSAYTPPPNPAWQPPERGKVRFCAGRAQTGPWKTLKLAAPGDTGDARTEIPPERAVQVLSR